MDEFLLELGINFLGGLLEGGLNALVELFRKPEAKPFIDLHSL